MATAFQHLEQRPLRLPALAPGAACPLVPAQRLPYAYATYGPALGQGPVYALVYGPDGAFSFANAAAIGHGTPTTWGGDKMQWVGTPEFRGPAIVRG